MLAQASEYDVVLLLSVGPVSGDHEQTVADLRTLVRAGGYIVIDDGFLAEGVAHLRGAEGRRPPAGSHQLFAVTRSPVLDRSLPLLTRGL